MARPPTLRRSHALLLGLVHGPAELLPISSSAHTALIPWLLGWPAAELDPQLRKSLEVALHTGAGLALLIDARERTLAGRGPGRPNRRDLTLLALSLAPPACAGYLLEGPIERRLSGPRAIVLGLLAGSLAMWIADGPARGRAGAEGVDGGRTYGDARPLDGLLLGLAQAAALAPGVSRSGATLAVARARGFTPGGSRELARLTSIPVIVAASALKGRRLLSQRPSTTEASPTGIGAWIATGAVSSLASTSAALALARHDRRRPRGEDRGWGLRGYACYRCALALLVVARLRHMRHRDALGSSAGGAQ